MARIVTSRAAWPLLRIHWPTEPLTDEGIEGYIAESVTDLNRREVHCIMHMSTNTDGMSALHRKRLASHLETHRPAITEYTAGVAIISQSALVRGMIQAVNWITRIPCPHKAFAHEADALAWLAEQYQSKAGTAAPFSLEPSTDAGLAAG